MAHGRPQILGSRPHLTGGLAEAPIDHSVLICHLPTALSPTNVLDRYRRTLLTASTLGTPPDDVCGGPVSGHVPNMLNGLGLPSQSDGDSPPGLFRMPMTGYSLPAIGSIRQPRLNITKDPDEEPFDCRSGSKRIERARDKFDINLPAISHHRTNPTPLPGNGLRRSRICQMPSQAVSQVVSRESDVSDGRTIEQAVYGVAHER